MGILALLVLIVAVSGARSGPDLGLDRVVRDLRRPDAAAELPRVVAGRRGAPSGQRDPALRLAAWMFVRGNPREPVSPRGP
jgi:hypothetical protein